MKETIVTQLINAVERLYQEHLPHWEFPNKDFWIQEENRQMEKVWSDSRDADFGDNDFRTQKSFKQYYNETFNTKEK